MSAWFVGADHVDAILTWMEKDQSCKCYGTPWPGGGQSRNYWDDEDLTEIGKALLAANIASLRARYPDDWREMAPIDLNAYRFERDPAFMRSPNLAVTLIKQVQCFEYQSCEHDGWPTSWARDFCKTLVSAAIRSLEGYEAAPWGYDKPGRQSEAA
jgi:hypothetical protein